MYTGIQSIWLPFKKDIVYSVAETYPTFIRFFQKGSRIIRADDKFTKVEVYTKLLGFLQTRWEGKGIKQRNQQIDFTQTLGLFQGLKAIWDFKEEDNGTRVTIKTTFSKPKLIEGLLGKYVVEATTKKILLELKNALASKKYSTQNQG